MKGKQCMSNESHGCLEGKEKCTTYSHAYTAHWVRARERRILKQWQRWRINCNPQSEIESFWSEESSVLKIDRKWKKRNQINYRVNHFKIPLDARESLHAHRLIHTLIQSCVVVKPNKNSIGTFQNEKRRKNTNQQTNKQIKDKHTHSFIQSVCQSVSLCAFFSLSQ